MRDQKGSLMFTRIACGAGTFLTKIVFTSKTGALVGEIRTRTKRCPFSTFIGRMIRLPPKGNQGVLCSTQWLRNTLKEWLILDSICREKYGRARKGPNPSSHSLYTGDGVQDPGSRAVNYPFGISRYTMLAITEFWRTPRSCFAQIGSQSIWTQR